MSHNFFDNRHYVIISSGDAATVVDFSEVMETSFDTLRFSVDGTQTFVKYKGDIPPSVSSCPSKSEEYHHAEILEILSGEDWTPSGEFI